MRTNGKTFVVAVLAVITAFAIEAAAQDGLTGLEDVRGGRTARAQDRAGPGAFAGVYAARRVVTASTCRGSAVGDVAAAIWVVEWRASAGFGMTAFGTTQFRAFQGTMNGGAITLTSRAEDSVNTMTLTLTQAADGSLSGTETIADVASRCSVVRQVTARSMN